MDDNSVPSSIHDSDESSDDSGSGTEPDDNDQESVPGSQEESDDIDGVMPDDIEPGHSPVDELQTFDWNEIDDELKEFLDSENDSDSGSVTSTSSRISGRSTHSVNGGSGADKKRKHDETHGDEEEEDSDDGTNKLVKKQKTSGTRSTGLKVVKTPNSIASEHSLPTPAVTSDEAGDEAALKNTAGGDGADYNDKDDEGSDLDLEADLMAEFERAEAYDEEAQKSDLHST